MSHYIRWDDARVEPHVPNEAEHIERLCAIINSTQKQNFETHRHAFRGTHVKTQAVVKATLTVSPDLPPHLAQGLFANKGHSYPCALRFANEPSLLQDDRAPGPRGLGMRVFNVDGEHLDPAGDRTRTQDFTFNNAPVLELRDSKTATEIFTLRDKYMWRDQDKLQQELKKRSDKDLQQAPMQLPNNHFAGYTMYSQSAYRYGRYVCKYSLTPSTSSQRNLASSYKISPASSPSQHSQWLREYFLLNTASYDFRVQLLLDIDQQSVEDTGQEWDEEKFPWETVGTVVVQAGQEAFDTRRRVFWEEKVKLNVWEGLKEHQPLGSVNRLRKEVYRASQAWRSAVNDTQLVDVDSIDQIP